MSDKQLIIELPEELVAQADAAHIDMRAVFERALLLELTKQQVAVKDANPKELSLEEKQELLRQILPPERLNEALKALSEGKRIIGLSEGEIHASDDFDEPLPDEFWGDLFK